MLDDLQTLLPSADGNLWFCGVEGIVADNEDPLHLNRIKAIIPIIDEENVYDVWARRMCLFVGAPGYGDFHPPELKTEVVLFGRMGHKHHLFYAPVCNEDYPVPTEFQKTDTRGLRSDGDYFLITKGDLYLKGGRVIIESDSSVRVNHVAGYFVKLVKRALGL